MSQPVSLVILAVQRSGSTYFVDRIRQTGCGGNPREWLQPFERDECRRRYGVPADGDYLTLWSEIQTRERGCNGVFGVKVMYDSWFQHFLPWLRAIPRLAGKEDEEIFKLFFPNPHVVLISRRNKLAQAVSWVKALRTGLWEYREKEVAYPREALVFDFLQVVETLKRIEQEEAAWRCFGEHGSFPFREVVFEDFCKDWAGETQRVLTSIGIPCSRPVEAGDSGLRVMNDEVNRMWLSSYNDNQKKIREIESGQGFLSLPVPECRANVQILPGRHPAFRTLSGMTFEGLAEMQEDVLRTETMTRFVLKVRVRNLSQFDWPALGKLDGQLWVLLRATWTRHGAVDRRDEGRGYLPVAVSPGAEVMIDLPLIAPEKSGSYLLEIALEQQGVGVLGGAGSVSAVRVEVQIPSYESAAVAFFGPLAQLPEGWKRSGWYGDLMDWNYPWIFHAEHGWQQCLERQEGVLQLEDSALGILEIRPEEYPCVVQARTGRRLRYEQGSGSMRRFQCEQSGEWLEFPRKEG